MIDAKILAHSINEFGDELITFDVTFPRIILAEVNTHRMFSKNTSSSRAIPIKKMIEVVQETPFIPIAWQKAHRGMQGSEYFTDNDATIINVGDIFDEQILKAIHAKPYLKGKWLEARNNVVKIAKDIDDVKTTKQLSNRLLEPFMWVRMIITTSIPGLENFFNLRCPQYDLGDGVLHRSRKNAIKYISDNNLDQFEGIFITELDWLMSNKSAAEIHIQALAEKMYDEYNESEPNKLLGGEWHIPFSKDIIGYDLGNSYPSYYLSGAGHGVKKDDIEKFLEWRLQTKIKVATAIAAGYSYTKIGDSKRTKIDRLINLHDRLLEEFHMSPFEHCNKTMTVEERDKAIKTEMYKDEDGNVQFREEKGWCRNIKGFIPYRVYVENEIEIF